MSTVQIGIETSARRTRHMTHPAVSFVRDSPLDFFLANAKQALARTLMRLQTETRGACTPAASDAHVARRVLAYG